MMRPGVLALVLAVALSVPARASEVVDEIARLYANAYYEEALALAETAEAKQVQPEELTRTETYRLLCLVALGREGEANASAERLIWADPAGPPPSSLPPPVQSMLQRARVRVLPQIARERYQRGRDSFARQQYADALADFDMFLNLVDNKDLGLSSEPALTDLREVVGGFRELAAARLAPPPEAEPTLPPAVVEPPPPPASRNIVPPEPINQRLPPLPREVAVALSEPRVGLLEVTIDSKGIVESVRLQQPIHPMYDRLVLWNAKAWRYRPALQDGVPVTYTKLVEIRVSP